MRISWRTARILVVCGLVLMVIGAIDPDELFMPEVLVSAKAMQMGMDVVRPKLVESGAELAGKILVGTVKGDLHDIGKNLVGMLLEGAGYQVIDLGIDVSPEKFVEEVKVKKPEMVGMSALLTTTMPSMKETIDAFIAAGVRHQVKVIVGGAPVTQDFASQIGADGFAPDASQAARLTETLTAR